MNDSLRRYIIVGPARSGTTVTHLCVAGHPNVSAITDEVKVRPFFTEGLSVFTHGNDPENEKKSGFLALFDTLSTLNAPERLQACGLKTAIINHEEAATFVASVKNYFPQTKIILTLRDDIVAQLGSLQRASQTGKWHSWVEQKNKLEGQVQLNNERLRNHAIDYLKIVEELKTLHETHQVFEISYEREILPGDLGVYHRLFAFLDLPDAQINWIESEKVAPPPADFIADYHRHVETVQQLQQEFANNPAVFADTIETEDTKTGFLQRLRRRITGPDA